MSKWELRKSGGEIMGIKEFIYEWKTWGFKIACKNWVFCFCKWFIGAKRLRATYEKNN